jgi:hypothetical protein
MVRYALENNVQGGTRDVGASGIAISQNKPDDAIVWFQGSMWKTRIATTPL